MEVQITFYVFTIRLKNVTVILWHYIKGSGSTTKPIDKLSTGLRSTNTLNINFFLLPTKFLQLVDNLITGQPHRSTHSSSVVAISRPPTIFSLKITDRSFRYASPRLWNRLPDSSRQPRQSCLFTSSFTSQLITVIVTTLIIHHSFTFISGSKPTFLTYPSHLDTSSTLDCLRDHRTDWTYHVYRFILNSFFSCFFLFVPCGGLSWLHVSFLLHVKYTLSYRISTRQIKRLVMANADIIALSSIILCLHSTPDFCITCWGKPGVCTPSVKQEAHLLLRELTLR